MIVVLFDVPPVSLDLHLVLVEWLGRKVGFIALRVGPVDQHQHGLVGSHPVPQRGLGSAKLGTRHISEEHPQDLPGPHDLSLADPRLGDDVDRLPVSGDDLRVAVKPPECPRKSLGHGHDSFRGSADIDVVGKILRPGLHHAEAGMKHGHESDPRSS